MRLYVTLMHLKTIINLRSKYELGNDYARTSRSNCRIDWNIIFCLPFLLFIVTGLILTLALFLLSFIKVCNFLHCYPIVGIS
jgi:hypothetical protein